MDDIKYWVVDEDEKYTDFSDKVVAFRYAQTIGATDIYVTTPDATYYWDWMEKKWEEKD